MTEGMKRHGMQRFFDKVSERKGNKAERDKKRILGENERMGQKMSEREGGGGIGGWGRGKGSEGKGSEGRGGQRGGEGRDGEGRGEGREEESEGG
ncbi:uncharacterized protein MONOS_10002 [Monocercomonoides exilis]|uniref:uncharacterized protein n=1 Tax=Monocercomonoides exilis TaxID=2049356 RepID=UPI00355AA5CC|nr:hypothetical protein MONOS_10002 [Monocercomonoides exilis]|eukprot:MONOS_10002.1-p1 / transcript=MONOS_10002.1 / gene=MONOS_10002 / organism=Monocercomonoides_exilis_PA203 / gene_product=unspecified product / transcript_product=unspecified product / location=Mono_scaffold00436:11579-12164(+) / protein_length=95 / sequence_SO=supercontig / SO=protein_coding / is_pseudo=false